MSPEKCRLRLPDAAGVLPCLIWGAKSFSKPRFHKIRSLTPVRNAVRIFSCHRLTFHLINCEIVRAKSRREYRRNRRQQVHPCTHPAIVSEDVRLVTTG